MTVDAITLIQSRADLQGMAYVEFQPGTFVGNHWQEGSVFLTQQLHRGASRSRHSICSKGSGRNEGAQCATVMGAPELVHLLTTAS